jgi:hypothetical protein
MGLLVPEVILSSGQTVSNVYISFHNQVVSCAPKNGGDYRISVWAIIYASPQMEHPYLDSIEMVVSGVDLSKGPFTTAYQSLKAMYPAGVDYHPEDNI